jgi:hypothetical protein
MVTKNPNAFMVLLPDEISKKLRVATDRKKLSYAPTITAVITRGVELALQELDKKRN